MVRGKESCRFVFSIDVIQRSVTVEVDEADLEMVELSGRSYPKLRFFIQRSAGFSWLH
jgi:hypothetical protein